jgi:hypothetical protein
LHSELAQSQASNETFKKELAGAESRSRQLAHNLEQSAKLYKDQVTEHVSFWNF